MNAIALASSAALRVGQLIRLLGSNRPGEIIAAANALNRTLSCANVDIHDLAAVVERGLQHDVPAEPATVGGILRQCRKHFGKLSCREQEFVLSLERMVYRLGDDFEPSQKQWAWLHSIHDRLLRSWA